jgi:hypothetical protein
LSQNLELLVGVARKIQPLLVDLVFVGGAIVELYFTDPVSERVRPTTDADAICEVTSYTEYQRLGDRLRELSFRQSARDADPVYRWRSEGYVLDLMPTDESILGFSNPWYELALERNVAVEIDDDLKVRVPEPPVFLASKLAAHADRGRDDPPTSVDLEDVVALLSSRPELCAEVERSDPSLRSWVGQQMISAFPRQSTRELVGSFLPEVRWTPEIREDVVERVRRLQTMKS